MRIRLLLTVLALFGGRLERGMLVILLCSTGCFAFFFCINGFRFGGQIFVFDNVIAFRSFM